MLTLIANGTILTPQGWLKNSSLLIEDGIIKDIISDYPEISDCRTIDANGCLIVPGGIDLHVHGGAGSDFMNATEEDFRKIISLHQQHGTTSILPTLAACNRETIERAIDVTEKMMSEKNSPVIGLHLEGPYLNKDMAGAQEIENIKDPDPNEYKDIIARTNCIKRWDCAPELPGAMAFAKYATSKNILTSIAHTKAEYKKVREAVEAGYTHATHFYNAMTGFHKSREFKHEGTVESIYISDEINIELIADGIHVPIPMLKLAHKIKGTEKITLVTDAMAFTGTHSSSSIDPRIIIEDGVCKLADRSALAGSIATMDKLIQVMTVECGLPLEDVMKMVSENPAKLMGVYDRKGSLEKGKDADFLILNKDISLASVWRIGNEIQKSYYTT